MYNANSINPITRLDYPDLDVIRVNDTYYMVSTTMHFFPGCEILQSFDLINWEHATYVYETLDDTVAQSLDDGQNIYGQGMWAASLRYHNGTFYVCFVANDTHKTYLYRSNSIQGPWKRNYIEGFYHDCSILFDDDNRVYIAYGNKDIYITELNSELTAPLENGFHKLVISDTNNNNLGYEGSHFYKINGKYYLFFIHSRPEAWRRVQCCFIADSLDGKWQGYEILNDDRGYCGQGVAQGGIVDTPDGNWYSILFQDSGAVGRLPILIPMTWKDDIPVLGDNGHIPDDFTITSTRPEHVYSPLVGSDDFRSETLLPRWQFNHMPDWSLISHDYHKGIWQVTTGNVVCNMTQAKNTITQRMLFPGCKASITLDPCKLQDGDYAGICALQGCYGLLAITRKINQLYIVICTNDGEEMIASVDEAPIQLQLKVEFENMKDTATFSYKIEDSIISIDRELPLFFKVDHFTGCRFGLVMYSTKQPGGSAMFSNFLYNSFYDYTN